MPKTSDDLIAPNYLERLMGVLLASPGCPMCHAAGLVFSGTHKVRSCYPPEHSLEAVGSDAFARACHVMQRYTSAPSFGESIVGTPSISSRPSVTGPASISRGR